MRSANITTSFRAEGGVLGEVVFLLPSGPWSPLHRAPWLGSPTPGADGLLAWLEGDFFCCPFGSNAKRFPGDPPHPLHGRCANETWTSLPGDESTFRATFADARWWVEKRIELLPDVPGLVQTHRLTGRGPVCYGHHAMLQTEGQSVRWFTAPFVHGQVFPDDFESPATQGRQRLTPGARFTDLAAVRSPGGPVDLTQPPHAPGHEDLVQVHLAPDQPFGWHVAVFGGRRLWVSLRDARTLPATVVWMSEGGRDAPPWNGRHRGVLALEDTCSHFHYGLAESVEADRPDRRTCAVLTPDQPLVTRSAMLALESPTPVGEVFGLELSEDRLRIETDAGPLEAPFERARLLGEG